jgi:hypothetical protein
LLLVAMGELDMDVLERDYIKALETN